MDEGGWRVDGMVWRVDEGGWRVDESGWRMDEDGGLVEASVCVDETGRVEEEG